MQIAFVFLLFSGPEPEAPEPVGCWLLATEGYLFLF
jgi:hypothetical protein